MSKLIAVLIAVVFVVAGFIAALEFGFVPKQQNGPYDEFIMCLKKSGAKFYGDYADVDSLRQMSFFGESLLTLEKSGIYIECNHYGPNPKVEKCVSNEVRVYPTWMIGGRKYTGIQGLNKLSKVSGCEYGK